MAKEYTNQTRNIYDDMTVYFHFATCSKEYLRIMQDKRLEYVIRELKNEEVSTLKGIKEWLTA